MIYPKLENEKINVKNFLAIRSGEFSCGVITAIIGEQASGKSILAKLLYFFRDFQRDYFDANIISGETWPVFKKSKINEFYQLFPGSDSDSGLFKISYKCGEIEICIERERLNHRPKLSVSNFYTKLHSKIKNDYKKYLNEQNETRVRYFSTSLYGYAQSNNVRDEFYQGLPSVLYVPASRAFFSTIEANVFAFLSEQKNSLDPLMIQFGRFFEFSKSRFLGDYGEMDKKYLKKAQGIISNILTGDFVREKDKDIIKTSWGKVELKNSSSGQQEVLPLLLALLQFPSDKRPNELIIIEEPEAHLFPTAQKRILELIVDTAIEKSCSIFLATHSPYILACINNQIHQANRISEPLSVSAFFVEKGKVNNIFDLDDKLIDMSTLDAVSNQISDEFFEALND